MSYTVSRFTIVIYQTKAFLKSDYVKSKQGRKKWFVEEMLRLTDLRSNKNDLQHKANSVFSPIPLRIAGDAFTIHFVALFTV